MLTIFNIEASQRDPGAAFSGPKKQLCLPYSQKSAQLLPTYSRVIKVLTSLTHMDSDIAILRVEQCSPNLEPTQMLWHLICRNEWMPGWAIILLCMGELAPQQGKRYKSNFKQPKLTKTRCGIWSCFWKVLSGTCFLTTCAASLVSKVRRKATENTFSSAFP